MEFFTIGVYNSTERAFFEKLTQNRIDTFCDIRQRRGVRGAKYSFVNSKRLQERLKDLDISYSYIRELAPTVEIREFQKSSDRKNREKKRERNILAEDFVAAYRERILERFDFNGLFGNLARIGSAKIAIFCVEENAEACHRYLVSEKLSVDFDLGITHL